MSKRALEVDRVSMQFGGLKALSEVSFHVDEGELVALIGPNGAGKTTLFNVLTGIYRPTSGDVRLNGLSIVGQKPFQIARRGLTRTFQNIRLFKKLSVYDNVRIGAHRQTTGGFWGAIFQRPAVLKTEQSIRRTALDLIDALGLTPRLHEQADRLPYGEQRRLEIARALATGARTILLDEPAAGMNERETEVLMQDLKAIRARFQLTLLLIEHDMRLVMGLSERIVVLDHGAVIAEGQPEVVRRDEAVIQAYLGASARQISAAQVYAVPSVRASLFSPLSDAGQEPPTPQPPLLSLDNVSVNYGPIQAIRGVSLTVHPNELVTLVGSNGAGKSSLLRAISGMKALSGGTIHFAGQPIHNLPPSDIVRLGISHAPEGRRIFAALTVEENLKLGAYFRSDKPGIASDIEKNLLLFPRLRERFHQLAGTLSGGEQQMLAIARALMARPKVLLLDEPSLGLSPIFIEQIFNIIRDIKKETAVLLIEQNAYQALLTASRGYVLENGQITLSGPASELLQHPSVKSAYLG